MYETQDYVVPLIWEGDGSHPSPHYSERGDLYEVYGIPHAQFQGVNEVIGGGGNMLSFYTTEYISFVNIDSPFEISLEMNLVNNSIDLTADVLVTGNVTSTDLNKIIFIVTYNFGSTYSCTVQRYNEQDFNLVNIGNSEIFTTSFDFDPGWDLRNVRGVAIIQKMDGTPGDYPVHQSAILEYPLVASDPITNQEMQLNDTILLDLTDYFSYNSIPVAADLTVQSSDPSIVEATLDGTNLILSSSDISSSVQVDIFGEYNGINTVSSFDVFTTGLNDHYVVIVDLSDNYTAAALQTALQNTYVGGDVYVATDINEYEFNSITDAVFVLLGVFPDNFQLTGNESSALADYLLNGGNVYMEGGDTWAYDNPTAVHSFFKINGLNDGSSDLVNVQGHDFLDGMNWSYTGNNGWIDQVEPIAPAVSIFSNPDVGYVCGVAYDSGNYKTVGTSFEITGLGGTNSLDDAVLGIIEFFEIDGEPLLHPINLQVTSFPADDFATFTWESPISDELTGYNVYLDGEFQDYTTDLEWQFFNLENGTNYLAGVEAVYDNGVSDMALSNFVYTGTTAGIDLILKPELNGIYPNPFNPTTTIAFSITNDQQKTEISIYNLKGQKIITLVDDTFSAGKHTVMWNGTDSNGKKLASGMYLSKMKTADYTSTKKMILLK
ncbi:T9SS type A sorting domain-containing protein [Candidatus Cloacimonadota bacterium]